MYQVTENLLKKTSIFLSSAKTIRYKSCAAQGFAGMLKLKTLLDGIRMIATNKKAVK
jgi:hypothetical protein